MKIWIMGFLLVGIVALGEPVGPNLVKNPGFEETTADGAAMHWKYDPSVYRVVDVGRNGGKCMSFTNSDPNVYRLCTIAVDCEPGTMYEFSCWVKTEDVQGKDGGATLCLEAYDKGAYLGGGYLSGVKGTTDWTQIQSRWRIPALANHAVLNVYVNKGMTGKAWFDDVSCRRYYPPLVGSLTDNLYRGMAAEGPIEFRVGMNLGTWNTDLADVRGSFRIYAADGQGIATLPPTEVTEHYAAAVIDAAELPNGKYRVVADFSLKDGTHQGTSERRFEKVAALPKRRNYIDGHRRLIVDGKPFFPLGMYWGEVEEADLRLFSKTAFNCLMAYCPPDDMAKMDMIDRCGLKILYSVKDIFHEIHGCPKDITTEAEERAFIQRKTERFKDHPALLAWYINDELPATMMERLDGRQRLMEELDPDHPTWVVLYQYQEISSYLNSFDVIGTDPYPIPGDLGEAGVQARAVRRQTNGQRAMWQVPQAFDWACYRDTEEARSQTRPPTEEEMRAMSWMAIVNGANGLIYYSFFDLKRPVVKIPFEESFGNVCRVAEEIRRFVPVILSIEPAPQAKVVKGDIDVRVWSHEGRTYLLAVNGKNDSVNAQVSVNKEFANASNVLGAQGGVTWTGEVLDLEFASYEAKMIVLQ